MTAISAAEQPVKGVAPARADVAEAPIAPGKVLKERFLLTQLVARGGTSYVYRARDLLALKYNTDDAQIAIKIPRTDQTWSARCGADMAALEALTLRRLSHPGIVKAYDFDRDGELSFVTMEWLDGESLAELLARSPQRRIPRKTALLLASAIADALAAAHAADVAHGDLKPANIIITRSGAIKLIDFTTANLIGERSPPAASYTGYSPRYASPEVRRGLPAGSAADIYSLACVLLEMVTGQGPAAGAAGGPPKRGQGFNLWQRRHLARALQDDPGRRPHCPRELIRKLRRAERAPLRTAALLLAFASAISIALF